MNIEIKHPKKKTKEGTNFRSDMLASPDEIQRITKRWKRKYKEDLNLDKTTSVKEIEELWITLRKCR
ncbi:hypothetical protein [Bacillus mycoides]|uniref:hypothetical protein n=1 Tax=Bacillus mycoides TaxID=1405 RepID=UPI0011A94D09|nr:hypothetical protein [Bacillus mycoides]